ncbi:SecY-interacting protein Syd [Undibacterium sp. Di24W]
MKVGSFFSVNNVTGEVLLEEPGYAPIRSVAPSLSDFLKQLL